MNNHIPRWNSETRLCEFTLLASAPPLLHAQADAGGIAGLRRGHQVIVRDVFTVLLALLSWDVRHAENPGLHVETLGHLRAGVLHGHYGNLSHLVGATRNLDQDKETVQFNR